MTNTTATITPARLGWLRHKIEQVNRKVAKAGLPEFTLEWTEVTKAVPVEDAFAPDGYRYEHRTRYEVTITGDPVALDGGWTLAAVIDDIDQDGEHIVNTVPGVDEYPAEWHTATNECGHCQKRIGRKRLIGVVNEDGEHLLVGTTCAATYLGIDAKVLLRYADWAEEISGDDPDWEESFGGSADYSVPTRALVRHVAQAIEVVGWTSKGAARDHGGTATVDEVARLVLFPARVMDSEDIRQQEAILAVEPNEAEIDAAFAWAAANTDTTGYLVNLRVACGREWTQPKEMGLVASLLSAYRREIEKQESRKADDARKADAEPVPDTTDRIQIEGVVVKVDVKDNGYSIRHVMTVLDDRGFKVWGSQPSSIYPEVGDRVRFMAAVERSDRDDKFGFFTRPTKAEFIENEEAA